MSIENKAMPKVSVVIPTYGRAKMVKQAVLSAVAQDLEPTEVIVSDDQSPDDTYEVLTQLAEKISILKVTRNAVNTGGVQNWNNVIDNATGDYIAYCSDDDYFLPHHLKTSIEFLEKQPDIGLVHSGFVNLIESNQEMPIFSIELIDNKVKIIHGRKLIEHIISQTSYPFQPSTFVFRRSVWKSIGSFDSSYTVADTDWFIRVGLKIRIAYLPVPTVVNRRHADNWSNRVGSIGMNIEFHKMMQNAFRELENESLDYNLSYLRTKWLMFELMKFIRIYVARSRAGLFNISRNCSDAIWDIVFKGNRGAFYKFYIIVTLAVSRFLRVLQYILPGGVGKYQGLGKECPK